METGPSGPRNDVGVDTDPIWIAAADLNGDEKPDLVVSCEKAVDVLIGMGDGTFERGSNATGITDSRLQGLAAVDLDQDGKLDLIVAHQGGGFAYLLAGRGDGVFSSMRSRSTLSSGSQPVSVVSGLFDPDPRPDFAVAIPNQNQVAICLNATTWAASTIPVSSLFDRRSGLLLHLGTDDHESHELPDRIPIPLHVFHGRW